MPTEWETWGMQQHGLSYDNYPRPDGDVNHPYTDHIGSCFVCDPVSKRLWCAARLHTEASRISVYKFGAGHTSRTTAGL